MYGKTPNLFWYAVHEEQLRRHERFLALPPVGELVLGSPASYRFVRQGSALWDELHDGQGLERQYRIRSLVKFTKIIDRHNYGHITIWNYSMCLDA